MFLFYLLAEISITIIKNIIYVPILSSTVFNSKKIINSNLSWNSIHYIIIVCLNPPINICERILPISTEYQGGWIIYHINVSTPLNAQEMIIYI